jgi:hypothetical protein
MQRWLERNLCHEQIEVLREFPMQNATTFSGFMQFA